MSDWVALTARASLAAQVIVNVVSVVGVALPNADDTPDLRVILGLEAASQAIEFLYYAVAVLVFGGRIRTWTRYIDWYVSTPVMILSECMFFLHRRNESIYDLPGAFYAAVVLNAAMLSFGLAAETSALSRGPAVAVGSLFFVGSWTATASLVDDGDAVSVTVLFVTYGVWSLYGVAALLSEVWRNVSYNLLDIVSKNLFGVFLTVYMYS